ncbi:unnamed protein product [Brassica rapa subsp. trilocularis]
MFSSDQISKATNHLQRYCLFLKLIGSCLDFPLPVLVYEDLEYRALNIRGSVGSEDGPLLPWNVHLKIAKEVATAITYLHTAFPRIILHRDIKAANVFLDKNWKASLTDFSSAVTLPEGYVDSYYLATGIVTEYSDVFSFGILMLVLLLGRPQLLPDGHSDFRTSVLDYVKDLRERGEPVEFGGDMRPGQMNMLLDLALRYCEERNEDRPKMISHNMLRFLVKLLLLLKQTNKQTLFKLLYVAVRILMNMLLEKNCIQPYLCFAQKLQKKHVIAEMTSVGERMRMVQKERVLDIRFNICLLFPTTLSLCPLNNLIKKPQRKLYRLSLTHNGDGILEKEEGEGQGEKVVSKKWKHVSCATYSRQ